ncbi:hypothetical protein pdam_00021260 [Pocillopora damicornis]|uniref:BTB domain-containing protein n=1 Tax=Pocillopora damicornis TaxID=46731 RepID=A0A3M6U647_POCDA|nr:hypothetical protein pdam_00021260 [Pocillopora damicornis]
MDEVCDRKPSEEDLLGCWEIVSCKLQEERYPDVEGVQFSLEEGGDLIWSVPPTSEQDTLPFFSCETFVVDGFSGELVCYGSNVDKIALRCSLESNQLVLCYDRHLKLCCRKVDQVNSTNLSHGPYSLLSALKEGVFTDITLTASNGEKFQAHKTVLSCFFTDVCTWDKIPPLLENQPSDVLRALLHYLYTSCLPADISDETAKELQKISQLNGKDIGHLSKLCTEYLEATAVKNRIKSLLSDLYSILEYILQISESLASGFRHDRTSNGAVNTGNGCRVDPLKIVKVTKMSLRQLSIGMLKFVLLCDIFTKHKSDLSREERQDIIQHCWKRLPCFVELVEKFLTVFQGALSGLSESEREDMALHLIPEVCEFEITINNILSLMSTYFRCFRGDFTSLSEEQKLRSVLKTMDNMMLEIPDHIRTLHKFPRIFEKKMPWKQWKYLCKEWTSFVSLSLRKVLANKDILEPVVEQTIALIHEDQFTNLVQELGFRKESFSEDKDEDITREKKSRGRVESVITCPPADKSPLAQSVNQLLISGAHADMKFIFDKTDLSHYSACTECKRICDQNVMEIAAHRVIVATRCDWFRRALLSGMKESIERRILIPDTSPCLFYKFLGYLYSGILDKDSLSLDELAEVIALSDKYEVDSLKEICEGVLLRNIDEDNVLLYLGMAEQYSVARLKEESFNYITLHPEVLESEMFEELPGTLKQSIEDRIRQNMPQAKPITEEVNQALAVSINIISFNGSYPLLYYLVTLHKRLALSLAGVPVSPKNAIQLPQIGHEFQRADRVF